MQYTKIIRIKDKKVFWIGEEHKELKWLCRSDQTIIKPLSNVRDLENRFRYFVIGIDND